MYTVIIILIIAAMLLMIAGLILLIKCINNVSYNLEEYYKTLGNDICDILDRMNNFEDDLDYAISKLPKSRSKKVEITMATNETISDALKEEQS